MARNHVPRFVTQQKVKAQATVPDGHLSETPMTLLLGYLVMVEVAFVTLGTLDVIRPREHTRIFHAGTRT